MKKRYLILALFFLAVVILINISNVNAVGETNYCAEKTLSGAWCQNVPLSQVNQNFRYAPTSCESTSYCRLGTCIDSTEGTCLPNTPQRVCEDNSGVWNSEPVANIPQCQLGCCILGDQASFVTQTKCKRLSSTYELETNFRSDIRDEVSCIASASPNVKGACVFDEDFQRTCRLTTKSECNEVMATSNNVEFHEGFLCSAETLATNCGPTQQTTCVVEKDQVYFVDSCGNLANVYDASKVNDKEYWSKITEPDESCGLDSLNGNANSKTCGNCNYALGSTCKAYERGETTRPQYGDFICKDLGCEWQSESYQHGETWCSSSSETSKIKNAPGEEYFRLSCYNNEVTVEQCDSFRNQICEETDIGGFKFGLCKLNVWEDCAVQDNKESCEDIEARDCKWLEGQTSALFVDDNNKRYIVNSEGKLVPEDEASGETQAACVPKYAPGFNFWEATSDEKTNAEQWCPVANDFAIVKFEKKLFTGFKWKCVEGCDYVIGDNPNTAKVSSELEDRQSALCISLGDCGASVNYIGVEGYNNKSATVINSPES